MIKNHPLALLVAIFPGQISNARMGGVGLQAAVMEDHFTGAGMGDDLFRNRAGVAGIEKYAGQAQAKRGVGQVMAGGEHLKVDSLMPKAVTDRNQLEDIPKVSTAFRQYTGIVGNALLQVGQQGGRHIQWHQLGLGRKAQAKEQPFQAADMIQVQMGDEQGRWQPLVELFIAGRSEERRVGKEWSTRV